MIHRICESKHNLAPLCASIVMSHTSLLTSSPVITLFEHNHMCETPLYLVAFRSNPETLKAILSSANLATVFDINKQKGFFKSIGEILNLISFHFVSFCFVLLIIMIFVYFRIFAFSQIVLIWNSHLHMIFSYILESGGSRGPQRMEDVFRLGNINTKLKVHSIALIIYRVQN